MNIKRTIETTNAKYDLLDLTDEQFYTIRVAYKQYLRYINHHSDKDDLLEKLDKMAESAETII